MTDLNDMSLEKLKLWSINALRVFFSVRKQPITRNFDEIVAIFSIKTLIRSGTEFVFGEFSI